MKNRATEQGIGLLPNQLRWFAPGSWKAVFQCPEGQDVQAISKVHKHPGPSSHTHCTLMCLNCCSEDSSAARLSNMPMLGFIFATLAWSARSPSFQKFPSSFTATNVRERMLTYPFNRRDLKLGRRGLPVKGNIWRRWPKKLRTLKIDARRCRRTPPQQVMIPLLAVCAREAIRKRAEGMYWYSASEHRRYFHSAHLALSTLIDSFWGAMPARSSHWQTFKLTMISHELNRLATGAQSDLGIFPCRVVRIAFFLLPFSPYHPYHRVVCVLTYLETYRLSSESADVEEAARRFAELREQYDEVCLGSIF